MSHFLSTEEKDLIYKLYNSGMMQKEIAARVGKTPVTVCKALKPLKKEVTSHQRQTVEKGIECHEIKDEDLSTLPDNVLFKHDRTFIF